MSLRTPALVLLIGALCPMSAASADPAETVLYSFGGQTGSSPSSGLTQDARGRFYGTTLLGGIGSPGNGTVYSMTKGPGGWRQTVLYAFTGERDGRGPVAGVIAGPDGSLYGTSQLGGSKALGPDGGGVVFQLTPPRAGQTAWKETVLEAFRGSDGAYPNGGLTLDATGKLYGTTFAGGRYDRGTVFELSPPAHGSSQWGMHVVHSFTNADGGQPLGNLIIDANGSLYGTTPDGGPNGYGVAFRLVRTEAGGSTRWHYDLLYAFSGGADGGYPYAGVIADRAGNLYGTTNGGGVVPCHSESTGCGVVFELTPGGLNARWTESVLHTFSGGLDGGVPEQGSLSFDTAGYLYGSTIFGGAPWPGGGVIYKLGQTGSAWKETALHTFAGSPDGSGPEDSPLILAPDLMLGTTVAGGASNQGSIFILSR